MLVNAGNEIMVAPESLLKELEEWSVVDVRSPAEFAKGHLPGSRNLPLFSDDGRAEVGRLYKRKNKQAATLHGLSLVGPRMKELAEGMLAAAKAGPLLLLCWRGGMRSASMAWLASQVGLEVARLEGGYKGFRSAVLAQFEIPRQICLLGGETGAGKTACLEAMRDAGGNMIDLEGLAEHKGSAFGALGEAPQPSQQTFENRLGVALTKASLEQTLWLESESRRIGRVVIPPGIFGQMQAAPQVRLNVPRARRVERLIVDYGGFSADELCEAIERIEQRLGGVHTKAATTMVREGDLAGCCALLLEFYYDRSYLNCLQKRPHVTSVAWDGVVKEMDGLLAQLEAAALEGFAALSDD